MLCLHYENDLRSKYPRVAPLPAVLSIARTNVTDSVIFIDTVELATAVSGVLMSYQFRLSSLHCNLNCGAVVVIAHIFTTSCILFDAHENNTEEVAFREFTFMVLSNNLFCGSAL